MMSQSIVQQLTALEEQHRFAVNMEVDALQLRMNSLEEIRNQEREEYKMMKEKFELLLGREK